MERDRLARLRNMSFQVDPTGDSPGLKGSLEGRAAATWIIPLEVSVRVGNPTLGPLPTAPVRVRPPPVEGLFGRKPSAPTSKLPYPFSKASLTATRLDWHAALSLALEDAGELQATARDLWGLEACQYLVADDTHCFIASTPQTVLIAFRGTASVGDWLADLNVFSTSRPYGLVHRGFLNAFKVRQGGSAQLF
jgi:hypothetical protein